MPCNLQGTCGPIYKTTRRHIPEGSDLHSYRREDRISDLLNLIHRGTYTPRQTQLE
jgi:hypothetical protein